MGRRGHSLLLIAVLGVSGSPASAQPPAEGTAPQTPAAQDASGKLPTEAELAVKVVREGTSAKAMKDQARKAFPWAQLTADNQRIANVVLTDISLFRRLPAVSCPIDARTYKYFIESPEVAVSIWRALGISRLTLTKTGPDAFEADTLDGSSGTVQVLLRSQTQVVVYCDGMFKSPVLPKPIKARTLVVLSTSLQPRTDGASDLCHTIDMFVSFPSVTVETIARCVSPLSYKYADHNLEEITSFLRMMDLSMARQPEWVIQVAGQLEGVEAAKRQALIQLTSDVVASAANAERKSSAAPLQSAAAATPTATR